MRAIACIALLYCNYMEKIPCESAPKSAGASALRNLFVSTLPERQDVQPIRVSLTRIRHPGNVPRQKGSGCDRLRYVVRNAFQSTHLYTFTSFIRVILGAGRDKGPARDVILREGRVGISGSTSPGGQHLVCGPGRGHPVVATDRVAGQGRWGVLPFRKAVQGFRRVPTCLHTRIAKVPFGRTSQVHVHRRPVCRLTGPRHSNSEYLEQKAHLTSEIENGLLNAASPSRKGGAVHDNKWRPDRSEAPGTGGQLDICPHDQRPGNRRIPHPADFSISPRCCMARLPGMPMRK